MEIGGDACLIDYSSDVLSRIGFIVGVSRLWIRDMEKLLLSLSLLRVWKFGSLEFVRKWIVAGKI